MAIAALAPLLAAPLAAQAPELVLRVGDPVPGAGAIVDFERLHVTANGTWSVQVRTDHPLAHTAVLGPWGVDLAVGDTPLSLGGGVVTGLRATSWDLFSIPTSIVDVAGAAFLEAVVYGGGMQFSEGSPATHFGASFPAGSVWRDFDELQFATGNPAYLLRGSIDDVLGGQPDQSFAAVAWHSGSIGALGYVDVIARESELAPGLTRAIESVRAEPGAARLDRSGHQTIWSCDLEGPTADDGCVYLTTSGAVPVHELLAREGSPSPVAGRNWGALEDVSTFAGAGGWTLRAHLGGDPADDEVLVHDGDVLAREGRVHPLTAPWPIESLGQCPAWIDALGGVLWFARWDDPTTPGADEALIHGGVVLARTGSTLVGGVPLADIESGPDSLALQLDQGDVVLFLGSLADGARGVLRIDLGAVQSYCTAKTNSLGCPPILGWGGYEPSAGSGLPFNLFAQLLVPNQPGLILYGKEGPAALPFGGGLLCVDAPLWRIAAGSTGGSSGCTGKILYDFNAWIAGGADPDLQPGQRVYLQMWHRDPGFAPPNDVGLTSALSFAIGP